MSNITETSATTDTSVPDAAAAAPSAVDGDGGRPRVDETEVEGFRHHVDVILSKVDPVGILFQFALYWRFTPALGLDSLEQQVKEVEQFYFDVAKKQAHPSRGRSVGKEKDKEKHVPGVKKQQQDTARREANAAKQMQELMRQFGAILCQLTQHKWAGPFMQPVDARGLGLHDYHQVIEKPMDLGTIKDLMEAKDGSGYKNVREIYADVSLVFNNAMKYNNEKNDVHDMAKTLLDKFEEKWLQFLPKVTEEERRRSCRSPSGYAARSGGYLCQNGTRYQLTSSSRLICIWMSSEKWSSRNAGKYLQKRKET
ncbi:hypothetical protein MLD38_003725 [Melastoma candidum]|uniref:Uncharacterized protein n=1 Tax=Melastoma candidum TaxID=119954 RepID=A0ACB9S469_9MYRT|nr:hypothetical protein MLD38_003725 [Melastoma candidum]